MCFSRFLCCCRSNDPSRLVVTDFQSTGDSQNRRRLLIFVNPKSGSGQSTRIFRQKVLPVLQQNSIMFELIQTEAPGHAARIVAERRDLLDFDAIVIVSGDGLNFEILNSLIRRKDAITVLDKLPFAIIPCGSGNGLLSSVFVYRRKPVDGKKFLNTAIETLGYFDAVSLPVNLVRIQTNAGRSLASFLSVGWGLISDIDIESEALRTVCGGNRFFWGGLWRVAVSRTYRARLSFLEAPSDLRPSNTDPTPVYGRGVKGRNLPDLSERSSMSAANGDLWKEHTQVEVPDLDSPVPSVWKTIDDDFLSIYAVSLSHISNVSVYAPEAKLNEQQIHLTYVLRKDVNSKSEVVKFLTAIESQKHLDIPFCHYVKVQAFRLEPNEEECRRSPIVIDGEAIPETKIQAVVTNLCMRVMSK